MLKAGAGEAKFSAEDAAEGLVIHFGSHVAALMEDRPPIGTLDASDLVAHQLEGVPEMLSLGELLAKRNNPRFDLLRVAHRQPQADLVVGGDVMLGRTVGEQIQAGADPFAGIRGYLDARSVEIRKPRMRHFRQRHGGSRKAVLLPRSRPGDGRPDRGRDQCRGPGEQSRGRFRKRCAHRFDRAFDGEQHRRGGRGGNAGRRLRPAFFHHRAMDEERRSSR